MTLLRVSRRPSPLPWHLSPNAFTVADALANGATRKRLRASDLTSPFHGVRVVGPASTWESLVRAYAVRMPTDARFSHTTAALLHRMRMPTRFEPDVIHVTVQGPGRAPRVKGVKGHRLTAPADRSDVDGLPCSTPIDTWAECATVVSTDDLVIMADGLVRRRNPLATIHDLERRVRRAGRGRGTVALRSALELVRENTDSAMETVTRLLLMRAGLPEPEVNGPIVIGEQTFHGDLVYRAERVIVEYDGEIHRSDENYFGDIRRLDALMEAGWRVIRVDRLLLGQPEVLVAKVRRALGGL